MEAQNKMNELVPIDAKQRLENAASEIVRHLQQYGFEDSELYQYIKGLVRDKDNEEEDE